MGYMKSLDIRIRMGGEDAIAAAYEMADLVDMRRAYEDTMNSTGDISDIVTVLRGVGFATISPQAGESASLLHHCVKHAADEIERLRMTNEERAAIKDSIKTVSEELDLMDGEDSLITSTLRNLLERTATP